jgi:type II secretory pathway pseudopilin PulG
VTLVELVVVLSVMAVVASIGATLVRRIVASQQDNRGRLVLAQQADSALAQLNDALSNALPNSLRVTSNAEGV